MFSTLKNTAFLLGQQRIAGRPAPLTTAISGIKPLMPSFKQPTFQERAALAAKAKQAALEKLRAKPPLDEAVVAERRAARAAKEEAQAKAREEKLAARALEKEAKQAAAAKPEAQAKAAPTEAEKKAARDARYAARKNRAGRR